MTNFTGAPNGEFIAERIESANSQRAQPCIYEGPIWADGFLYFSEFTLEPGFPSRIQRLDSAGRLSTWMDDSGSNGLAFDGQGNIVAATHKYKGLTRYNIATGLRTAFIKHYNSNVFNSPNDLVIAEDGTIYFTDPDFQKSAAPGGQEKTGVYSVSNDGNVQLIDDSIANPNGIALSSDGNKLYVTGGGELGVLRQYLIADGRPKMIKDLVTGLTLPDGITVDSNGDIYVAEHTAQRVSVFTPFGKHVATIHTDDNVTNTTFGGELGNILYLTGTGAVWKIRLGINQSHASKNHMPNP